MIELVNVRKKYNKKDLINIDYFKFEDNKLYIINDKNGTGKSTLLKMIINQIRYDGDIYIDGISNKNINIFNHIAYMSQNNTLLNNLNYEENLSLNNSLLLEENSITSTDAKIIKKHSSGQIKSLNLNRIKDLNKKIILLDEASVSLDNNNKNKLLNYLNEIKKDRLIIFVTHDTFFFDVADEILSISDICENSSNTVDYKITEKTSNKRQSIKKLWKILFDNKKQNVFNTILFFMFGLILSLVINFSLANTERANTLMRKYMPFCSVIETTYGKIDKTLFNDFSYIHTNLYISFFANGKNYNITNVYLTNKEEITISDFTYDKIKSYKLDAVISSIKDCNFKLNIDNIDNTYIFNHINEMNNIMLSEADYIIIPFSIIEQFDLPLCNYEPVVKYGDDIPKGYQVLQTNLPGILHDIVLFSNITLSIILFIMVIYILYKFIRENNIDKFNNDVINKLYCFGANKETIRNVYLKYNIFNILIPSIIGSIISSIIIISLYSLVKNETYSLFNILPYTINFIDILSPIILSTIIIFVLDYLKFNRRSF